MLIIDDGWANTGRRGVCSVIRLQHFLLTTLTTVHTPHPYTPLTSRSKLICEQCTQCDGLRIVPNVTNSKQWSTKQQKTADRATIVAQWLEQILPSFGLTCTLNIVAPAHRSIVLSSKYDVYSFNQRIIVYFLHFVTWHIFSVYREHAIRSIFDYENERKKKTHTFLNGLNAPLCSNRLTFSHWINGSASSLLPFLDSLVNCSDFFLWFWGRLPFENVFARSHAHANGSI